jgi:hypothetical protein
MKHAPKPPEAAGREALGAAVAHEAAAGAEAVAALIATAIAIVPAAEAEAAEKAAARVAASRRKIIATVPGSHANHAGSEQPVFLTTLFVRTRFHTRRLVWLRRNPRFRSAKKK